MRGLRVLGIALVFVSVSAFAHASLIGDTVNQDSGFLSPASAVVGEDVEFDFFLDLGSSSVDVEYDLGAESLWVTYELVVAPQVTITSLAHTVTLSDLDWFDDMGNPIAGEIVGFNLVGGPAPQLDSFDFTADSLTLNWNEFSQTNGTLTVMLHFDIIVEHGDTPAIPEPATAVVLGLGLTGFALRRRRG